jgi:hypothetical protein
MLITLPLVLYYPCSFRYASPTNRPTNTTSQPEGTGLEVCARRSGLIEFSRSSCFHSFIHRARFDLHPRLISLASPRVRDWRRAPDVVSLSSPVKHLASLPLFIMFCSTGIPDQHHQPARGYGTGGVHQTWWVGRVESNAFGVIMV